MIPIRSMMFRKRPFTLHTRKSGIDETNATLPEPPAIKHVTNPPRKCPWCNETSYRVSYQTHGLHFRCGGQYNPSVPHEHHPGAGCVEFWKDKLDGTSEKDP